MGGGVLQHGRRRGVAVQLPRPMGVCLWTLWLDVGVEILNLLTPDPLISLSALLSTSQGTLFRVSTPSHL
eukprot:9308202-Prorocentrum_lima.AAC.1